MVDVYPMDTAVLWTEDEEGNDYPLYDYLAVFVTPKSDAVQELLAIAKEYAVDEYGSYSEYDLYRSLPGYQCGDCTEEEWEVYTALQVMAIYNALKYYYGVSYLNMPTAFGVEKDFVQRINLPEESLRLGSANCIDGAVLFASALEAIGIQPFIVIVPGHAFVAWSINPGGEKTVALETTMIGEYDFEDAYIKGNQELAEYWDALTDDNYENGALIDVMEMHEQGILPIR